MRKAIDILKRTAQGREALYEIIEVYGGFNNPSSTDPLELARQVARRQPAVDVIQNLLTDEFNAFTLMLSERVDRLNANKGEEENDD